MDINGGKRRRKDTRDFPTVPSRGSKRPGRISSRGDSRRASNLVIGEDIPSDSSGSNTADSQTRLSAPGISTSIRQWRVLFTKPARHELFPAGTWRALWLGFQSWLVFWALLVMLAVVSWVLTASQPAMAATTWRDAMMVGNGAFAMSFGATFTATTLKFSLVPWGLTCLVGVLLTVSLRAAKPASPWALLWGLLAFVLPAGLCLGWARTHLSVWTAFVTLGIFALVVFLAVARRLSWWNLGEVFPGGEPWPWLVLTGRLVRVLSRITLGVSALALLAGVVCGWGDMTRIWVSLHPDWVGSVALAFGVLAYLPTLLGWTASWLVGSGFTVGQNTVFSPGQVISGDLPPVPFLAWLPHTPVGWWPVAIPVIAGILGGLLMSRRHEVPLSDTMLSLALMLAILLGGGFVIISAVSGSLGPGRLIAVGPTPATLYAGVIAWGVPFGATLVLAHRRVAVAATRFSYRITGKNVDALPTTELNL